ncbi:MAG: SDR family oxidoreductase [Chloroflexota bacterium]|nr:SDR family oxidoreductase [Chloroflexota bacterium]
MTAQPAHPGGSPLIAVAGATGTLGPLLVAVLQARGLGVRVVTRNAAAARRKVPGLDVVEADIATRDEAIRALRGASVVVSAISGFASKGGVRAVDLEANRTLAGAARAVGVEHFVLLSVSGASADHPIELFRMKHAAEEAVRACGVPWTIIRPSAYLETWLGLVGGPLVEKGKTLVYGRGRNPINFVSAGDVARFVELAITDPSLRGRSIEVPGPQNLTLDELVVIVQRATGLTGKVSHAPTPIMRILSVALRPLDPMRAGQIATAVVMDSRDMTLDGASAREAYPSIPMTSAEEVAERLFGSGRPPRGQPHTAPAEGPASPYPPPPG